MFSIVQIFNIIFRKFIRIIISNYYNRTTESTTIPKPCEDESWCQAAKVDATVCNTSPEIYQKCFSSCSDCSKCKDEEPFCSNINLNPILCKHGPSYRERCPKACQLCHESSLKGIR